MIVPVELRVIPFLLIVDVVTSHPPIVALDVVSFPVAASIVVISWVVDELNFNPSLLRTNPAPVTLITKPD